MSGLIIGIDPGITGAVGILDLTSGEFKAVHSIPVMEAGKGKQKVKNQVDPVSLANLLEDVTFWDNQEENLKVFAVLERVNTMPFKGSGGAACRACGQVRNERGLASNGSIMHSRGIIEGVLGALEIPYELVAPVSWKKFFGLIGASKDASRSIAIARFPTADLKLKKDVNKAEALLLAEYGRVARKI